MSTQVDKFAEEHKEVKIGYVHGEEPVYDACKDGKCAGLLLPSLDKSRFLETIHDIGTLPRKAFSMGEASEKRFYIEARNILPEDAPAPTDPAKEEMPAKTEAVVEPPAATAVTAVESPAGDAAKAEEPTLDRPAEESPIAEPVAVTAEVNVESAVAPKFGWACFCQQN